MTRGVNWAKPIKLPESIGGVLDLGTQKGTQLGKPQSGVLDDAARHIADLGGFSWAGPIPPRKKKASLWFDDAIRVLWE